MSSQRVATQLIIMAHWYPPRGAISRAQPDRRDATHPRTPRTVFIPRTYTHRALVNTAHPSQVIPTQLKVVSRERASNMYPVLPYYVATFLVNIPLEALPALVYSAIVYFMTNLRPGFDHYLIYTSIFMLENVVCIALGMV